MLSNSRYLGSGAKKNKNKNAPPRSSSGSSINGNGTTVTGVAAMSRRSASHAASPSSGGVVRVPVAAGLRRPRPPPSSVPSIRAAFSRKNPTFWIGVSMFCLVIFYVVIVIFVAKVHLGGSGGGGGGGGLIDTDTSSYSQSQLLRKQPPGSGDRDRTATLKQRLEEAKDAKQRRKQQQQQQPGIDADSNAIAEKQKQQENSKQQQKDGKSVIQQAQILIPHVGEEVVAVRDDPPPESHPTPRNVLKAYLEPSNFDEWDVKPLPPRSKAKKGNLKEVSYPRLRSCSRLPQQFPIDDGPVDADPFLPWLHDVFPTPDGRYIQFVAQNRRRCHTGKKESDIMAAMQPQASIFQHVPVRRVNVTSDVGGAKAATTRYRVVPYEQADPDGMTTRFVCRFKPGMEETLSVFNIDYDWTAYRKRYKVSFAKDDGGIKNIHMSQLNFRCPVPTHLQETVRTGSSVKDDWASMFVDLIPIRTPPRWGSPNQYLAPWFEDNFRAKPPDEDVFDPADAWGPEGHLLPAIDDSGRWENIPICKPSAMTYENEEGGLGAPDAAAVAADGKNGTTDKSKKKHKLVSCIWASAGYATRGDRFAVNDGQRRLLEWITHNKIIGFDHFYVYDNSGAFGDGASLKGVADLFPGEVTYIPWPAKVCNNNPNNVDSVGERSSQYAAESSCLLRFGPHVEWIGQFDIDEYLIPMGEHQTALDLLNKLDVEDTRIVSFKSWRAWPRWSYIEPPVPITDWHECWGKGPCFDLRVPLNFTMLQAYNCDRNPPGKKAKSMPAEKQIYRAEYVTQHFVHYSAATVLSAKNQSEYRREGWPWGRRAFPDKRQRFANEVKEGLMIHSKAVARQDTNQWEKVCHIDNQKMPEERRGLCRLGVPWPKDPDIAKLNATKEGWAYNCYVNEKVETYFVPRLEKALKERLKLLDGAAYQDKRRTRT